MSSKDVAVFIPQPKLVVDNDELANERCRGVLDALSKETDSISLFCIIKRSSGQTTFHSSHTSIANMLLELERFKHDLLSGRYGDTDFDLG